MRHLNPLMSRDSRRPRSLWVVVVIAFVVAGCLDEPAGVEGKQGARMSTAPTSALATTLAPAPEPTVDEVRGAISGRVVDEEQRPVPGARITHVQSTLSVPSDAEGRFTINGLDAGRHTLVVSRAGYKEGARHVDVVAGETSTITIEIQLEPSLTDPTIIHLTPWDGMIGCGIGFFILTSADLCSGLEAPSEHTFTVARHLSAVHWEMHWSPGAGATARYLRTTWPAPTTACSAAGTSPVVHSCAFPTEGDLWESNETALMHYTRAIGNSTAPAPDQAPAWLDEHSGPVVQQRFRVYITLFYNGGQVPEGFRNGPPEDG